MSEQESPYGREMNEALAYGWATQAMRGLEGKLEPAAMQTLADRLVSAILEAYQKGKRSSLTERCTYCNKWVPFHLLDFTLKGRLCLKCR